MKQPPYGNRPRRRVSSGQGCLAWRPSRNLGVLAWLVGMGLSAGTGCQRDGQAGRAGPERLVNVLVVEAKRRPVSESLALVGSFSADEMVEIKSETDGKVETIAFQEGQTVEEGDLLIQLDETKFAATLAEAEANFKLSQANFERGKQLYQDRLISQQEYEQILAIFQANEASLTLKRRQLKDARIYAPFRGVVGSRSVSPGQVISRNTTLTWLVDLDPIKVEINVPERFLGQLQLGQTIHLTVAAFPERDIQGEVYFIAPFVDPATRTALVKARVPNPDFDLVPGMFANLSLTLKIRENAVVIPEEALTKLLDDGSGTLFIVDEQDQAQLRQVQLGVRLPNQVEVLSGLEGGEKVIVEGTQKIGPGAKVQYALADAKPTTGPPAASETPDQPLGR